MNLDGEVLAAQARALVDRHGDDWDVPHTFLTLHPDEAGGLRPGVLAMITLDVDPVDFPALIARLAANWMAEHPDDPPYAYGLMIEAFAATAPPPQASNETRKRFARARATRTFYQHPDAREIVTAWVVDVHGHSWQCTKERGTGEVTQEFYPSGSTRAGGRLVAALLQAALATGASA